MAKYTRPFVERLDASPDSVGTLLAKECVRLKIPTKTVQERIGVSKQTVYAWFRGGKIARPYRPNVELMLEILAVSNTAEEADKQLCKSLPPKHSELMSLSALQKRLALMKTGRHSRKKS